MTQDQKIDILFYLVSTGSILFIALFAKRLNSDLSLFAAQNKIKKINKLETLGKHQKIIDIIDEYINRFPGETTFKWYKGRALFKLKRYEASKSVFSGIVSDEPLWKEDAQKYLESINDIQNT